MFPNPVTLSYSHSTFNAKSKIYIHCFLSDLIILQSVILISLGLLLDWYSEIGFKEVNFSWSMFVVSEFPTPKYD